MVFSFFCQNFTEEDLTDLHGEVAIVTGSNTGVGYGTMQWLVRKSANLKVYIAGWNEERILAAIKQLESEGIKDGSLHFLKTDLADPRLAKQAAEEFHQKEMHLDILVIGWLIQADTTSTSDLRGANGPFLLNNDGLLDIMTTNHISHFAFTEGLLPLLKATSQEEGSDVHIVNVASIADNRVAPESFAGKDTLNKNYGNSLDGCLNTYGLSKLANILHIKSLQRQLDSENVSITCITVHPGAVASIAANIFINGIPYIGKFAATFIAPLFLSSWLQGGMNPAFAAASKAVKEDMGKYKGMYLVPVGKITEPSLSARDERLARELEETTREVLKEIGE